MGVALVQLIPLDTVLNSPSPSPLTLVYSEPSSSTHARSLTPAKPTTGLPTLAKANSAPATPLTSAASTLFATAPNLCTPTTTGQPLYPPTPSSRSAPRKPLSLPSQHTRLPCSILSLVLQSFPTWSTPRSLLPHSPTVVVVC